MQVLGLDVGTSSIGWCVLEKDKILGIGVRAFPAKQGLTGQSPFQQYIAHRATRRKNKANKTRLKRLAQTLVEFQMLPENKSPWSHDARQLLLSGEIAPLTLLEFGSVMMFLGKHKGSIRPHPTNPRKTKGQFNNLPFKNGPWQRRDATRLFARLWRFQRSFSNELTRSLQIAVARHLFSCVLPVEKRKPQEDLAPYRAANQLNLVLNAIIKKFGRPQLISTELFKLPGNHIGFRQRDQKETHDNRIGKMRLVHRLWLELPEIEPGMRQCIYSGDYICQDDLQTDKVQIDHIVPRSNGGGNRKENLLLCTQKSNLEKANKTPNKVAGWQKSWPEILHRAQNLPATKLAKIEGGKLQDARSDYNHRLGTLSKKTWQICSTLIADRFKNTNTKIVGIAGHETSKHRDIWDLDPLIQPFGAVGSRHDQRHHAIDAFVLAAIASGASQRLLGSHLKHVLASRMASIVTSYKADHKQLAVSANRGNKSLQCSGFLAHETSYGPTKLFGDHGRQFGVIRRPVSLLKKLSDVALVRDALLRQMLEAKITEKNSNQNGFSDDAFIGTTATIDAKRIRVLEPILNAVHVANPDGKVVKLLKPGANHRFDVWQLPNGKWQSEIITTASLYDPAWQSHVKAQYPAARKVLKLHHDDCIALEEAIGTTLFRVAKFSANDRIYLVPINAAGDLKFRDADPNDFLSYSVRSAAGLKQRQARQVRVDILGQVSDPEFHEQNLVAKPLKKAGVS